MMDAELAGLGESCDVLADTLPPFWWQLFRNLMKEGFTEMQAMRLLITYIKASNGTSGGDGE